MTETIQPVNMSEHLITDREREIRNLESGVQEVAELFQDISILVSTQGDQLDNIETNIITTTNNTQQAVLQLDNASRMQKKSRKRKICCCLTILSTITILILIIIITN